MFKSRQQRRTPSNNKTAGDELRAALNECRSSIPMMMILGLFFNLLYLAMPLYTMQVFDRVLSSGRIETLILLTVIATVSLFFMGALEAVRGMILSRASRWLEKKLAAQMIGWSIQARLLGISQHQQPLRDLATIRSVFTAQAITPLTDFPWSPIYMIVCAIISPWFGVLGVVAAVALLGIAIVNEAASRKVMRQAMKMANDNVQGAEAAIRNADAFQAMGMLPGFLVGWVERNQFAQDRQLTATDLNSALYGLTKFIRMLVQILVMGLGAYLVLQGQLSGGGMIAASMLLSRSLTPFEQAIGSWKILISARDSYERLTSLLDLLPAAESTMRLPEPRGQLTFENVTFVAPGRSQPILHGIRFEVEPADVLGIIGPSASGKSTLCRRITGISKPTHGSARLDGADLTNWPVDQLGQAIGYLPQDVELFDGKVSTNIARLMPNPDIDAVLEAAKIAGIHEMILRLPEGYETEIGESGSRLSGGQRQRIGLARALYGRPRLIVLDEPNASLDSEGEACLIRAIEAAKGWGATVIIVAHQPHILRPAEKLLVIRNGTVQLFGPRDEVLTKLGIVRQQGAPDGKSNGPVQQPAPASSLALPPADFLRQRMSGGTSSTTTKT